MTGLRAYGHSWIAGAGASHPTRRFVELVACRLGCSATNLGVGGSLSTDTARLLSRLRRPTSDVHLVMTGLNDARLQGASAQGLESYAAALTAIFGALSRGKSGARLITVEQPHLLDYSLHTPHHRGSDDIIDAYNERLRAVALAHRGLVLVTVEPWNPAMMLAEDTVHPNDAGHARVADEVVRAVRQAAPEFDTPRSA